MSNSNKSGGYLDDYSHLLAPPNQDEGKEDINNKDTESETTNPNNTDLVPHDPNAKLKPANKYRKPRRAVPGQVQDIEDIIFNGSCRPRPDKIKWMCTFRRHLIPGELYRWCQCGKSGDIYCDDTCTEEPTRLGPLEFSVVDKVTNHALCGCRYTAHPPFCDGTHGVPFLDLEEWLDEHPEDRHRVDWLVKGEDGQWVARNPPQVDGGDCDNRTVGCQGQCHHGDPVQQGCDWEKQDACNEMGKCLDRHWANPFLIVPPSRHHCALFHWPSHETFQTNERIVTQQPWST